MKKVQIKRKPAKKRVRAKETTAAVMEDLKLIWRRLGQIDETLERHEQEIGRLVQAETSQPPLRPMGMGVPYVNQDQVVAAINRVFDADDVSHKKLRTTLIAEVQRLLYVKRA